MNTFLLELRNLRKSSLIQALVLTGFIGGMMAFFPSMKTESMQALANTTIEGIDPSLLAAFGLAQMPDFSNPTQFFGYVLQYLVLGLMIMIAFQSVSLLIKEETDGTIEYLSAKPVSRTQIFAEKILAVIAVWFILLLVCTLATGVSYIVFAEYSFSEALNESVTLFSAVFFVGLIFSSIGFLLSTLIKSSKSTSGVSMLLVLGSYILGILSVMIESLDYLKWLSPMNWIKADKLMSEGILFNEFLAGASDIALCIFAAWFIYRRKDLLI